MGRKATIAQHNEGKGEVKVLAISVCGTLCVWFGHSRRLTDS